jgi:neutral amino acid transport system permease protein
MSYSTDPMRADDHDHQRSSSCASAPPGSRSRVVRACRWLIVLFVVGLVVDTGVVSAQDDEQAFFGTMTYTDPETNDRVPIEGAVISVESSDPEAIEAVDPVASADDGAFRVEVPEAGEYVLTLDPDTLPEGVFLDDPDRNPLTVTIREGADQIVVFRLTILEEGDRGATSGGITGRRFAQLTAEGLKQGLYLAMAAIGLSMIFGTTGLTNFAHAELVTFGMLGTYFFNFYGLAGVIGFLAPLPPPFGDGMNLVFATFFGMLAGGLFGWVINRFIFRGARRSGVGLLAQMLMTIGLSILIRYIFLYVFRGGPRTFGQFTAQRAVKIGPIELTPKDMIAMSLAIIILILVGVFLQLTRTGKAMRAVADNRDLAESTGINVERVIATVWVAGAALAALGGTFFGLTQVRWDFGFRNLLLLFAAVVLGGLGTAYGALLGAIVVGLAINLSTIVIDAELKNMVALLVMVVILLVRPQGILGRPERIG